eukprot:GFUD01003598.1.p1 GENE.GFUD01003598.1~~GFUD01003598.1.p1  ORF type:complete len:145 (+),score=40.22 GFUD01003598.1:182-616(+)
MALRGMALPQDVFRDFCDVTGHLPKEKVGDAVRCLGENPLQSEIRDITNKFKGQGLSFQQFEEVVRICRKQNQSPVDELSESLAVFDVDGEGFIPRSQIKHLICSEESGEGLTAANFEMLMERIETNEDGMVRIADLVHLLEQK